MNNLIYSNNSQFTPPTIPCNQKNKKLNFKQIKINTCNSLNEVECFLNDFHRFCNYIKLYKILK